MNNNSDISIVGQPILCNCPAWFEGTYQPKYQTKLLGSVTAQGIIIIYRGHKDYTFIKGMSEFYIECPKCKYSQYIKIDSMEQNYPARYGNNTITNSQLPQTAVNL